MGVGIPRRKLEEEPSPKAEMLPVVSGGASSWGGTGAYSAMVVGLVCGMLRADGRTITAMRIAVTRAIVMGG